MGKIVCNLFGVPQVLKDGQSVYMPYVKMSAFLYYMVVNKKVSRSEMAGLLWPEESDQNARKNLRNAIYRLHQTLGEELIVSPSKAILLLSDTAELEVDTTRFDEDPQGNLYLYQGEFLQGFSLKDAGDYENWIMSMRSQYEKAFVASCSQRIEEDIENEHFDDVEENIRRLIAIDEYDEKTYRQLMRFYQRTGRNSKAIEIYNNLSRMLHRELGIDPDAETKEIYDDLLRQMKLGEEQHEKQEEVFFYGRYHELALLERAMQDFRQDKFDKAILLRGEMGIGKAAFCERLLKFTDEKVIVLRMICFREEQGYSLRPWNRFARELIKQLRQLGVLLPEWERLLNDMFPDFSNRPTAAMFAGRVVAGMQTRAIHAVSGALQKLSESRRMVLAIESLQWMDEDSLRMLTAVLQESDPKRVMLMATCSKERSSATEDFIAAMQSRQRLMCVELERLDYQLCYHYIKEAMKDRGLDRDMIRQIYAETEGNPFFLKECLATLHSGQQQTLNKAMTDKLGAEFLYLTEREREILKIASLFRGGAPVHYLSVLLDMPQEERDKALAELRRRYILIDDDRGDDFIAFSHIKLREYIYESQSWADRRSCHKKVGELIENEPGEHGEEWCEELAYHFGTAGEHYKAFKYRLELLRHSLDISHEMFPVLSEQSSQRKQTPYVPRAQIEQQFSDLEGQLNELNSSGADEREIANLTIDFFYLRGRHYIREGDYEQGLRDVQYVIDHAQTAEKWNYVLEGYKQIVLCYLQTNDSRNMQHYLDLATELAAKRNDLREIAICCRLRGLLNLMVGSFAESEEMLNLSIRLLTITEKMTGRHATNIAAAYDYLGEICLATEQYEKALELFEHAISLCIHENIASSLSQFYIDSGRAAYALGDEGMAQSYFTKAESLYGQFDSLWRRSLLDSYMALIYMHEKQYHKAQQAILSAQQKVGFIKSPSDLGAVCCAKALLRRQMDSDPKLRKQMSRLLKEDVKTYCEEAQRYLNRYIDACELKLIENIFPEKQGKED